MNPQPLKLVDAETCKVWFAAIGSLGLTVAQINGILTTVVLIGSAIYTWRKALMPKGKVRKEEEDREL